MTELQTTRTLETVTAEINGIRSNVRRVLLEAGIEIGRRLVEAKEMLPYGEWGEWLAEKVDFSQDAAERLMKLYYGYADRQTSLFGAEMDSATLRNLSISNALLLLKLPEDERESFAEENDVEHMSTRELDRLLRERDEARDEWKKLKEKLAEAKEAAEVAKKEAEDWKESASDAVKKLAAASPEERERLEREVGDLKKKLAMSDAAVVIFNIHFDAIQKTMAELLLAMKKVEDADTADRLRAALRKLLEHWGEKV